MKPLAILVPTLALVAATATVALAHVDSLGQPDPYWQQIAAASAPKGAPVPPAAATPLDDFVSLGGLSLLLLGLGAALALDLATAPGNSGGRRAGEQPTAFTAAVPAEPEVGVTQDTVRTVEVLPPSATREARHVLRTAAAIVFVVLFVSALHASERRAGSGLEATNLAPFQMRFRDAAPDVQRMFGGIQAGLTGVENLRVATKRWPAVETLAARGIPPFPAADSPYGWRLIEAGIYAAYVGTPTPGSKAPAFLAVFEEPPPGAETDAPPRVSIWFRDDGLVPDDQGTMAAVGQPSTAGWKQILAEQQRP